MGSWDHGIMGSWDHGIMGSWDHGIMGSWDHGIMGSWDHGIGHEIKDLWFSILDSRHIKEELLINDPIPSNLVILLRSFC
jgi:hypothetical protein